MCIQTWLFVVTKVVIVSSAFSASIDCTRAVSCAEKSVCSNKKFSRLDELLDNAYRVAVPCRVLALNRYDCPVREFVHEYAVIA